MKKYLKLFLILVSFFATFNVFAETKKAKIIYDEVNVRSGPGTNHTLVGKVNEGDMFDFADFNLQLNEKGCASGWYILKLNNGSNGYICADYVSVLTFNDNPSGEATSTCEQDLKAKGFPSSYWPYLCSLKAKYPNWNFVADINGLDFATAVSKEAVGKKSLININAQGYYSTASDSYDWLNDKFVVMEGSNWYAANSDVVAYYMDPRNFLDETEIFMFEKLSYDASYQTLDAVKAVLAGRDIVAESASIIDAAKTYNVNAIYLASRIRQETGGNYTNYSLSGKSVSVNGVYYNHIYNPYNIGANTGAQDGIVWAASGTTYLRPWTTISQAIHGGAYFISNSYIGQGQDTGYFQKYNTSTYSKSSPYSHQYMTNVKAAASEASISYDSYKSMGLLSSTNFTFVIPVYSNMNESNYKLPNKGNPNNHLKSLLVNGTAVGDFAHDKYNYTFYVAESSTSVNINGSVINSGATISGAGNIPLTGKETNVKLTVTAANGKTQVYTVKVVKTEGSSLSVKDIVSQSSLVISDNYVMFAVGNNIEAFNASVKKVSNNANLTVNGKISGLFATGDTVVVSNGGSTLSYNAVVKGDPTGDGTINIQDLLRIQKFILGYTDLSGSYLKACDTNNDDTCDIGDLLRVQKHILGYIVIQ